MPLAVSLGKSRPVERQLVPLAVSLGESRPVERQMVPLAVSLGPLHLNVHVVGPGIMLNLYMILMEVLNTDSSSNHNIIIKMDE